VIVVDFPDPTNFAYRQALHQVLLRHAGPTHLSASGYAVVQTTSPLVARHSFWTVVPPSNRWGLRARPTTRTCPVLANGALSSPVAGPGGCPRHCPPGLAFLNPQSLPLLFDFPLDMARVPAPVNRLSNQVLVHTYESEWGRVAH
jgi:spermidine synthase